MFFKSQCFYLFGIICAVVPLTVHGVDTPVTYAGGGNLTAFSGDTGAINNNQWNQFANPGKGTPNPAPQADFGNCNSLILRCATPKCASGGCTNMDVARPIVNGCVQSNENCKQYGSDLVDSIAAQLVANAVAKANEQQMAATAAAQSGSASQSSAQLQAMQEQMQSMQEQMSTQSAESSAAVQRALDEQKQLLAQQQTASSAATDITAAINNGVSADTLARDQASGQILSKLEGAGDALKTAKSVMQTAFDYAGCDSMANSCNAPKRVAAFKQKANEFFSPYDNVLDEVYDALIQAQALGVDITDIYMMLNGSCNVWGKYMCETCTAGDTSAAGSKCDDGYWTVAKDDTNGKIKSKQDKCQLMKMLTNNEEVQQNWMDMGKGDSGGIRVACASDSIESSMLFKSRKKQSNIDISILQMWLAQDSRLMPVTGSKKYQYDIKYCPSAGNVSNTETFLSTWTTTKKIPDTKICAKSDADGNIGTGTETCTEDSVYINPELALCSTHIHNIGQTTNDDLTNNKDQLNRILALKTTLIAQQMKKQYDFLETTIKRLQIQLQKSILTSKMEAAGAASDAAESLATNKEFQDCQFKDKAGTINCVRSNASAIQSMLGSNKNTSAMRNQIAKDAGILNGILPNDKKIESACTGKNFSGSMTATCLNSINGGLINLDSGSNNRGQVIQLSIPNQ